MIRPGARLERLGNTLWRTLIAFLPSLAQPDDAYARTLLSEAEFGLYQMMDVRDRAHACGVARRLVALDPAAPAELRRASLLHDVGKAGGRYNPLARIIAALYTPAQIAPAPRLSGLRGAWQVKRHHDRYGAELILAAGGGRRVAEIVARHHRPNGDLAAAQLRDVDARF